MLIDFNAAAGERVPPFCLVDLEHSVFESDCIVACDDSFPLKREDEIEVPVPDTQKGIAWMAAATAKRPFVFRDVVLSKKAVGIFHAVNSSQPQLLRQTLLPGLIAPLAPRASD